MSVGRGIQSVIFYYLSCAPCTKVANRRNRKKQGEKDRAEREAVALQNPNTYRQPSPFRTNEYWAEEIRAGPGPPMRRLPKKERRKRLLEQDGRGRSPTRKDTQEMSEKKDDLAVPEPAYLGGIRNIIKNNQNRLSGLESKWKDWRRFQREDEELWGGDSVEDLAPRLPDSRLGPIRHSVGGSSIGVPGPGQSDLHGNSTQRREGYWMARHPPVNDLHPPVVSVPNRSKLANQWMLQPPPPSAVMNGYKHSSRIRSDSETGGRREQRKKSKVDMVDGKGSVHGEKPAEPASERVSTQSRPAPASNPAMLDGVRDNASTHQQGDSGVDVSGSSDQSTTSQDQTIRHDFAYPFAQALHKQPIPRSRSPARRKPPSSITSHTSRGLKGSSNKKASRVAMPAEHSEHTEKKRPLRPRISRIASNPNSTSTINYISLDRAQLDGLLAVVNTTSKSRSPARRSYHDENDNDDEADADAEEDEEDAIDPLDPRPARRRQRGHTTTAQSPVDGRRKQGLLYPNLWGVKSNDEIDSWRQDEDDAEDEMDRGEVRPGYQRENEDENGRTVFRGSRSSYVLPMGPGICGRRWSFDL